MGSVNSRAELDWLEAFESRGILNETWRGKLKELYLKNLFENHSYVHEAELIDRYSFKVGTIASRSLS